MWVLSTKILSSSQKEFLNFPLSRLFDYDAIAIKEKEFSLPQEMKTLLFTSQNTVRIFLKKAEEVHLNLHNLEAFCVGEKTARLLSSAGIRVLHTEAYASDLLKVLPEKRTAHPVIFFCGNLRRDTLPEGMKKHGIVFLEIQVYDTILQPVKWEKQFDYVLFFSPSGAESFFSKNKLPATGTALCIGTTTAQATAKYTDKVLISEKPTVESVLEKLNFLIKDNK